MFKLTKEGIVAVKSLNTNSAFKVFIKELHIELKALDEQNRSFVDPNMLLRSSGKAQQIQGILDSVEAASKTYQQ